MSKRDALDEVPERVSFPEEERKILQFWEEKSAFHTSMDMSKGRQTFSFYDGPPFATGLPHYGNILAGTIKDVVTRYAYQTGHDVPRRFGWDCHGLPVEHEIDKKLGVKCREDVLRLGIDKYNAECRSIVLRYASEWETIVKRLGRWIDFKNDYKTLDMTYMESVWWVFKQLYLKGLVYRGFRVMPYSTALNTPMSNFEANLNYKEISDPSVIVSFPLLTDPNTCLLAWTTTPWTLPSNLSLCVHPDLDYVTVEDTIQGKKYIFAEGRKEECLKALRRDSKKASSEVLRITSRCKGTDLKGLQYQPLFEYFYERFKDKAFLVLVDEYVTSDTGTGIVHQAPAFGEDDFRVCSNAGIISYNDEVPCPIDDNGRFIQPVTDFCGLHVKEADKSIIQFIKSLNRLITNERIVHSYPFCWRSETPLIYRAVPSWFVRVESFRNRLTENNKKSSWVPEAVQFNRFGNWLENARDWNVSRNRYWGTPIPIWMSDDKQEIVVIGSEEELRQLAGLQEKLTDLHRDSIDHITIQSKSGKVLRRVDEVFDCWFESGSMPYASIHYPFEPDSEAVFRSTFPAVFVAEGLDQTRGWFYTLMVLSTALFDKPAFQHCIVNGLILAEDGKKMSKRLKNYPDPIQVTESHGADALRLYLINSPVVRAETLRFKESGVREVVRDVILPWYNAYRFFVQNVKQYELEMDEEFGAIELDLLSKSNVNEMDHWIESSLASLVLYVRKEMEAYHLYNVVPRLLGFIDSLTNWYVRLNRPRLKGNSGKKEWKTSLTVLGDVLIVFCRLMAPFAPFTSEMIFQNLKKVAPLDSFADSVHYLMIPEPRLHSIDQKFEQTVSYIQQVILLGRIARDRRNVPLKQPLRKLVIIHRDAQVLEAIRQLESYIVLELNVKQLVYTTEEKQYVLLRADADGRALGSKLGKDFAKIRSAIQQLSSDDIFELEQSGKLDIEGHCILLEQVKVIRQVKKDITMLQEEYEMVASNDTSGLLIFMDMKQDENLYEEGIARELINRVQKLRKKAGLLPRDEIEVFVDTDDVLLRRILQKYRNNLKEALHTPPPLTFEYKPNYVPIIEYSQVEAIHDMPLKICLVRAGLRPSRKLIKELVGDDARTESVVRYCLIRETSEILHPSI
ncbi:isoleucyl-tRNA synthetase isoform 2 [Galdieria sulphuraria]|uniref:isoleucine--tRNA ligase n=1 Tax=Galdieria sulphuraria TaxID=130081 RepID=M2XFJ0_GALSU|nr:isoleucyl-tRNA synthetase isoform 2 [Galdieria sulphuraria]EME28777.1 isoleucyl-tRNA synthetase isoform 2 [Galdieria sulphuraria]|eukprot:XP_005705297.1 isoleucyl-tRNA synthetase isoform 2 [Galdieria sulphuraria]